MSIKNLLFTAVITLVFISCNKEGEGGTSIIKGTLVGQNHSSAKAEVIEVIMTNGDEVDHGEYWLLNSPSTNDYFYIWYDNPTWVTNGNPNLSGRTGIAVQFNYSDSNTEIAANTSNAILNATDLFDIEILNDILIVTNKVKGETPDANEITTPFEINIDVQGEDETFSTETALLEEKIYITYGQNEIYNDEVQTGPNGAFQFTNLTKGDYVIHVFTKDSISGDAVANEYAVTIEKNKSVIDLETIHILY